MVLSDAVLGSVHYLALQLLQVLVMPTILGDGPHRFRRGQLLDPVHELSMEVQVKIQLLNFRADHNGVLGAASQMPVFPHRIQQVQGFNETELSYITNRLDCAV